MAFDNIVDTYILLDNHEEALNTLNLRLKKIEEDDKGAYYNIRKCRL